MDLLASAVAMGWSPYYPQFDRSSLDVADEARAAGRDVAEYVAEQLGRRNLKLAVTDPDNPVNWPRVLTVWRANLIGSSGKGANTSCGICWVPTPTRRRCRPRTGCGPST